MSGKTKMHNVLRTYLTPEGYVNMNSYDLAEQWPEFEDILIYEDSGADRFGDMCRQKALHRGMSKTLDTISGASYTVRPSKDPHFRLIGHIKSINAEIAGWARWHRMKLAAEARHKAKVEPIYKEKPRYQQESLEIRLARLEVENADQACEIADQAREIARLKLELLLLRANSA